MSSIRSFLISTAVSVSCLGLATVAHAETLLGALAKAYQNNASINSARAGVRVADEDVAIAKSGYRPRINGGANWTYSVVRSETIQVATRFIGGDIARIAEEVVTTGRSSTGSIGIEINQMLFDGFQTTNNVKAATSQVYAQRENLRNTTQNILSNAVNSYVDVLRTRKIAKLREQNISFLQEQLRAARVRLEVGEGTRTDVAQAEARLAGAQAQASEARANVVAAESVYRELVGETPRDLAQAKPSSKAITNFDKALEIAAVQHPAIRTRQHIADALAFQVKSAEGALLPQLRAEASASVSDSNPGGALVAGQQQQRGSFGVVLDVPIYQGGRTAATIRKAKERLGQGQIDIDAVRDEVRQQLAASTSAYTASLTGVRANRELVRAARLALDGVIEERRVGQRTTLDVLNAQNDVITAQIAEVNADADSVVASYAILSATGQLDPKKLGLDVREYKPEEHFEAVKDMWFGLRTPDGR